MASFFFFFTKDHNSAKYTVVYNYIVCAFSMMYYQHVLKEKMNVFLEGSETEGPPDVDTLRCKML